MTFAPGLAALRGPVLFALVGVLNTAIDYGVFALLVVFAQVPILAANVVGFCVGAANSFILNGLITFPERSARLASAGSVARHAVAVAVALGVSCAVLALASRIMPALAAKAVSIGFTLPVSFLLGRGFVYRVR